LPGKSAQKIIFSSAVKGTARQSVLLAAGADVRKKSFDFILGRMKSKLFKRFSETSGRRYALARRSF
jgi:hypothetical protein